MDRVKLGIVGLGRLGRQHAHNISGLIPEARLYAACSLVAEEVEAAKRDFSPEIVTMDFDELISLPKMDGLVIASNSQAHCDMICRALKAGVHNIYSEKPVGMTLEEIDQIRETVKEHKANIFQVGYNRRFDHNYQRMKAEIDSGRIGKPIIVKMINRDNLWREEDLVRFAPSSGGFIFDMCTHDFDAARWFLGSECSKVYAAGGVFRFEGIRGIDIDNVVLSVVFKNGAIGIFEASRNSASGYHMETEIFGTNGDIRVNSEPYEDRLIFADENGYHRKGFSWFYSYWEKTYIAEIRHFAECVLNNSRPIVTLADGCKTVEWAFAANRALDTGEVVRMD
ncbi:MAG: Gfo/Idh/MocA family oxidoreductase [Synergistaceae bacterium]|jgi:myo-inositol 2-dehydrogenase/D-chiro-inositol 1-dehydrogenase|nr:Gfo/Idh/MocA family oxidoreductase [Synergistaceae bacterium]